MLAACDRRLIRRVAFAPRTANHPTPVKPVKTAMLWPMLGGVRFLLALIVAGDHLALFFPASELSYNLKSLSSLAAVLGFLVISGFSIAASYAKEPQGFYW